MSTEPQFLFQGISFVSQRFNALLIFLSSDHAPGLVSGRDLIFLANRRYYYYYYYYYYY